MPPESRPRPARNPGRVVICGAGVIGAATAYYLTRRGVRPLIVDRGGPAAAASGRAAGFLALDWNGGTPLDGLARASFALHRELADSLGAERIGHRPLDTLMTAAADEGDLEPYRRIDNPAWLDGNAVAHEVIGDPTTTAQVTPRLFTEALIEAAVAAGAQLLTGVIEGLDFGGPAGALRGVIVNGQRHPADTAVLALGPWTPTAQRWMALPQVLGSRSASITLAATVPAQAIFSEFVAADGSRSTVEIYPRADGTVYVGGQPDHASLPDDPATIAPTPAAVAELRRIAGVHSSVLGRARLVRESACFRPLTIDGLPLIGALPDHPQVVLATAHASWGILNAPATGRMVSELLLDGHSHSLPADAFAPQRLPLGRL